MIHRQTVSRVWQQYLTTGNVEPKPKNSEKNQKSPHKPWKKSSQKIEKQPDTTLNGLIDKFSLPVSEAALSKRLKKAGLTYKKRHTTQKTKNTKT